MRQGHLSGTNRHVIGRSDRQSGENGLKIATAVENAQDHDPVGGHVQRNHGAAFEAENP
jgi:hypothetical protein